MNSGHKTILACISVGIVISMAMGSRPSKPLGTVPTVSYGQEKKTTRTVVTKEVITTPQYRYIVQVETTPESQLFSIEKSGYNQYTVSPRSEGYSVKSYEVLSDKPLTLDEAYSYLRKHPDKCRQVSNAEFNQYSTGSLIGGNIYDHYEAMREDYLSDPEDNITYSDDIFDFLDD